MVLCGMKRDGTFGLTVFRNENMMGPKYLRLLSHTVLPKLREWHGGNLDNLWWQQDGALCHVTAPNMRYLDRQFQERVLSRKPIRPGPGLGGPEPNLNPFRFLPLGLLEE